ncbi:L-glutamate gamma-semialdehyde dehydrogenase [Persicimonas caeni]|uniref:L-glutamate gamma-semialdehyde dehydrogenase n=1 Tax=Persicimonas caeni TaxID=2292766 RepID=A0A4Y6Q165_PERCE|nr:L-glutamate gamma-semialdehyde dehydrogenase [Persicimonas caeni]QDG53725.1 L-glutamate gamma-semialdehyde dehydrogenase [Persicimonas caeni]QED34946.1 L-glutamate gamma-semialdehyde dehydrogenase [Persicimonas caeni]
MARASEKQIKKLGEEIFSRMKGEKPSVFKKDWWSGKMMDWSMKDEAFKVEMFRFVDVFPTLKDHVQVAEHLQEYFCRPGQDFPSSFQWGLSKVKPDSWVAKKAAGQIEKQIHGMASKFIAGTDASEAIGGLREMWDSGLCFTLDLLGEATVSEKEAHDYLERYNEILDTLIAETAGWPEQPALEKSAWGRIPRVNVSVKISSLYSQLDAIDFDGSIEATKERLRPLFRKAKEHGAFINIDMESYKHKDLTIAIFKSLLEEPEFADFEHAGIVMQAYLKDAEDDVKALCKWAKKRKTPITVRLVKGAYWDYETIHSQQEGWENPVFSKKWQTDQSYENCTEILLDYHKYIRTAIGSHNVRSIAHAMAYADAKRLDKSAIEFQMLYGMAEPMKAAVSSMGYRLRDYVPIGEIIPGMAYLVRRLLENTSNESWLKMSFADGKSIDELLSAPEPPEGQVAADGGAPPHKQPITEHGFRNEPMRDFAHASDRERFQGALETVRGRLGMEYPLVINNEDVATSRSMKSVNPSRTDQLVGTVAVADIEHADQAIRAAWAAKDAWADTDPSERAEYLFKLADKMREWRDELAGWMVFEVGKNWREADADVCEAIDFCEYYGREMKRLAEPQRLGHIPGELNLMWYQPRGVAAIIAPWNFPLAILTGMTVAAAVTGNTVIMKPAEQSSVIAAKLMELCRSVGFPPGVINYLPGIGEEVGEHLVQSPYTHIIAFTGSMQVGLDIIRKAGDTDPTKQQRVKKVVCEMGGKNAIIVDADADLDEAVQGVIQSAFGFQGQKCSACSRAIVLASCYDEFKERVVEATRSLVIGPSDDPANRIGPVVDGDACNKINSYIEIGRQEGDLLISREVPEGGCFVGPTVVEGITPEHRLAHEEIFGPVLALMKAEDFDEALEIANGTRYALTGGVYSRSPMNIEKARAQFKVGNLYINQKCTGALVYRQPFGGFKMSGVGSKAGGPDYLLQFMEPRAVTENTMRRGFAPDELL